ncbi:MAG: ABC transporter substrate-binding protein [Methanomicrobiales archaeon]|nr:ABC transporter substrate-binding protein [Methanomicrobiales archaeon]
MTMRRAAGFFLILLAALLLAAAGCTGTGQPPAPETIRVGILFPLTGDLSYNGKDCTNGALLAIEEINAAGGIASLGGAKLEPVIADTRSNAADGTNATRNLIQNDNVVAIVGAYQSSVVRPATQVAEEYETPFIVSVGIADVITERGFRYTFRVIPKAQYYGRDQGRFLLDLERMTGQPVRRVALLHENTDFGTSSALAQKVALEKNGMVVATEVSYNPEKVTNLDTEIARVLASRPDAILEVTYAEDSILIRQALRRSGSTIPLIDTAGGTTLPEYTGRLGSAADGTFTSSEYSQYAPGGKEVNDRFRARFGANITGDSAYTYQAVWVLADALERAGKNDRGALRDALAKTDMPRGPHMILPAERIRFDEDGQNEFATLFIVQVQNGDYLPVWPREYATAVPRVEQGGGA